MSEKEIEALNVSDCDFLVLYTATGGTENTFSRLVTLRKPCLIYGIEFDNSLASGIEIK